MGEKRSPHTSNDAAVGVATRRHWVGFLASGALAFVVDATIMELGIRLFALPPLVARLAGVAFAMLAAWLAHRTLTFALTTSPTFAELGRFVASASTAALINYAAFALILLGWPSVPRIGALVIASCIATIFAYLSMRYAVFRRL